MKARKEQETFLVKVKEKIINPRQGAEDVGKRDGR